MTIENSKENEYIIRNKKILKNTLTLSKKYVKVRITTSKLDRISKDIVVFPSQDEPLEIILKNYFKSIEVTVRGLQ